MTTTGLALIAEMVVKTMTRTDLETSPVSVVGVVITVLGTPEALNIPLGINQVAGATTALATRVILAMVGLPLDMAMMIQAEPRKVC